MINQREIKNLLIIFTNNFESSSKVHPTNEGVKMSVDSKIETETYIPTSQIMWYHFN